MSTGIRHVHEVLLRAGYKADGSVTDLSVKKSKPLVYIKEHTVNGPACMCEEEPPRIVVEVFPWLIKTVSSDNAIQFSLCGARDFWARISIFSVKMESLETAIEEIEKRLNRMWKAFFFVSEE